MACGENTTNVATDATEETGCGGCGKITVYKLLGICGVRYLAKLLTGKIATIWGSLKVVGLSPLHLVKSYEDTTTVITGWIDEASVDEKGNYSGGIMSAEDKERLGELWGHYENGDFGCPCNNGETETKLEITSFKYPAQSYSYEAHSSVSAEEVVVALNTYTDGALTESKDVTEECELEYEGNVDWITKSVLMNPDGLLPIDIAENTSDEAREGTVHLTATYGEYTAEADSSVVLQGFNGTETEYKLEATLQYNGGNNIPVEGGTFDPELVCTLLTLVGGVATNSETVTPESTMYSIERDDWTDMEHEDTGVVTWSENEDAAARNTVISVKAYYTAPDGTELEAEVGCTVYQDGTEPAVVEEYGDVVIKEFSYPVASKEGERIYPTLSYSQTVKYSDGHTEEITSGATIDYSMSGFPDGASMNSVNGSIVVPATELTSANGGTVVIGQASVEVTLNGKSAKAECDVEQEIGTESVVEYKDPVVSLEYKDKVPAIGGSVSPTLSYSQSWTEDGEEQTPITSGGTVKYELVENLASDYYDVDVDEATGVVTATLKTQLLDTWDTSLCSVKATVTLNGKKGEAEKLVYLEDASLDLSGVVKDVEEKLSLEVNSGYRQIANGASIYEPSTNTNNAVMSEEATLPAGCQLVIKTNQDTFGLRCQEGNDSYFDEPLEKSSASVTVGIFINGADRPTYSFGGGSITGTGVAGEDSYNTCNLSNTVTIPAADEDRVIQLGIAVMSMELRYMAIIYLTTTINVTAEATVES